MANLLWSCLVKRIPAAKADTGAAKMDPAGAAGNLQIEDKVALAGRGAAPAETPAATR
jgi:hypothetical protein